MAPSARNDIWLAAGVRTPFAKVDGALSGADALALSVPVVRHMIDRLGGRPDFTVWGNVVPNLYNVFPKFNGATTIFNWQAKCQGAPCSFWMTDNANGDVACGGFEPNGDNNVNYRIYKWNEGCGVQGGWNDANNTMNYTGWVICSTNDC